MENQNIILLTLFLSLAMLGTLALIHNPELTDSSGLALAGAGKCSGTCTVTCNDNPAMSYKNDGTCTYSSTAKKCVCNAACDKGDTFSGSTGCGQT